MVLMPVTFLIFYFEGFTSIPTALTANEAMTGIEGFKYIKPVTVKEV